MSQVEAIEDNRKDEQNTVFLTSQAALVISLSCISNCLYREIIYGNERRRKSDCRTN